MVGKTIILLFLVIILAVGGVIWFDYLNIIDAKYVLAPIYKYIPFIKGEGRSEPKPKEDEIINIDAERLAIRLIALDLRNSEMDNRQKDLDSKYGEIVQMSQEMEERQKALDERENSLRAAAQDADDKSKNIDQLARYLTNMPPLNAVGILNTLDDQLAIDVLRKTEEIAQAAGTNSIVAYWFSQMDPVRAAELQRKMAGRPPSL